MRQTLPPIVVDAPQRSSEWFEARLGNVTASGVLKTRAYKAVTSSMLTKAKLEFTMNRGYKVDPVTGAINDEVLERLRNEYPAEFCLSAGVEVPESSERRTYRQNIVAERITKLPGELDPYISKDMLWGQMQEPQARALYAYMYKHRVEDAPLMLHPTMMCGASPDGLVVDSETGELGTLEVKCLRSANHLYKVIESSEVPYDYFDQIQMQMWITGRDWCDFVAYDSRVTDGLHIFVKRVEYDEFFVDNVLVPSIKRFLDECDHDERKFYAIAKRRQEEMREKMKAAFAT